MTYNWVQLAEKGDGEEHWKRREWSRSRGGCLERSGLPVTISIERRFPGHRLVGGK
ncbi:hypothetical protein WJ0W_003731 [Paenibacillus melissococcoides]|uniref:Uncharacterized protein n=1 Tax=Paenibacillus melissococcoides TaxID=2912268 RepID=A0ABM9G467_9BACL|nr:MULTISPECIES: hypothetical protein [Paenibacillus]MEB9894433.1 hypothetical protein [Bacillus cereus]CAH8246496.1 hypothetical protein WJ0W_003731 [Paenibacillus melissococcoides]CAH8714919.1 hypothetical protein HTL2_004103 [Paenibacillus melissococcoides]CAH8715874.1 hypothetical protein WDD9_004370 [Paenibacillus melissococcoides]